MAETGQHGFATLAAGPPLQTWAMAGLADLLFNALRTKSQWRVGALLGT